MSELIKVGSSINRKTVLFNILFAVNYKEEEKLRYTFENADAKECALALSFLSHEQLKTIVFMLKGQISPAIIASIKGEKKNDLLESIEEYNNGNQEHVTIINRDDFIQNTLNALTECISKRDKQKVAKLFESIEPSDAATLIEFLKPKQRYLLIELLDSNFKAEILTYVDPAIVSQILTRIDPKILSIYISELKAQDMVEILEQMEVKQRASTLDSIEKLKLISKDELRFIRKNLQYKEGTAGRIMGTPVAMAMTTTIQAAYKRYCSSAADSNQVIYVYNSALKIVGKIYLSTLCKLSQHQHAKLEPIGKFLQPVPFVVFVDTSIVEISFLVKKYYTIDIPVLTSAHRIVGAINAEQVISVFEVAEDRKMLTLGGLHDFDFHAGITLTVKRRMGALWIASFLCLFSAFLIHLFEDTIQALVPLAVFGPTIAGIGGNTASQVMTVTVRALSSGEIASGNRRRTISKEAFVCFVCGLWVGFMLSLITLSVWRSYLFSKIVFCCTTVNLFFSGLVGSGIPILLSSRKKDPALSSTIMNVITDVFGYGFFLGIAYIWRKPLEIELLKSKKPSAILQKLQEIVKPQA